MIYNAIIALLTISIAAQATNAAVVIDDRAAHAAKLIVVNDQVASVHAMASRNDSAGLVTSLKAADGDLAIDPVVRDYVLETTILALSGTTPTLAARTIVAEYQNRSVSSFIRLTNEHGNAVVPLYDLAAAARLTIRVWDTNDAKARVSEAIRSRQWTPANFLQTPAGMSASAWRDGTRQAIEAADRRLLVEQKAALLNARRDSDQFDALLVAMAIRLRDQDLYSAVFTHASPRDALEAANSVNQNFPPDEAAGVLRVAVARDEVASAAILELGKLATDDDAIRSWLLERLGNVRDGGSAALALARVADERVLGDIESIIKSDASELAKLRAALVLRLIETEAAKSLREDLLTRELSSAQLREALL